MTRRDGGELLLLAAIWGASFMFMRIAAGEFGPVALAGLRALGACALLCPMLWVRGEWPALRSHWRPIALVGIANSAIPFVCFGYAALAITGGLSSIFNATAPLWGMLIAWAWLGERPDARKLIGLGLGFVGVAWLAGGAAGFRQGAGGVSAAAAVAACVFATVMYGVAANVTRRWLVGVPSMAMAAGSQLAAGVVLMVPMVATWPASVPHARAWGAALALAVLCTGAAYLLYFRLIRRTGATTALSVTYLIPGFAMAWGGLFLHEPITARMLSACAVILVGTALGTGLWRPGARPATPTGSTGPVKS